MLRSSLITQFKVMLEQEDKHIPKTVSTNVILIPLFLFFSIFQIPVITSISPNEGPASGGTYVTIKGQNLNAGSSISASVAGKTCEIKT